MTSTTAKKAKKRVRRMDRRTSQRLATLASRVLASKGKCTPTEAKRLAACVLTQRAEIDRAK